MALVEVPGQYAGWLALDAGLAAGADVVLIPEVPYRAQVVARRINAAPHAALIVVAEGARAADQAQAGVAGSSADAMRAQLSPGSDPAYGTGAQVIHRAGRAWRRPSTKRCSGTARKSLFPLVLDQLVRAGAVSAADRVLGAVYGAAAVQALADGHDRHLIAARDERFEPVPLAEVVNRVRAVELSSPAIVSARGLGLSLGDAA